MSSKDRRNLGSDSTGDPVLRKQAISGWMERAMGGVWHGVVESCFQCSLVLAGRIMPLKCSIS